MKNLYPLILILIATLCSCQKVELLNPINSSDPVYDEEFKEAFDVDISYSHSYNMAYLTVVNVNCYEVTQVDVCAKICNRWYMLGSKSCGPGMNTITFDSPIDTDQYVVVAHNKAYMVTSGGTADLTKSGSMLPIGVDTAEPLGWIVALECGADKADFDFNDMVLRVVPQHDGNIYITALACGQGASLWLHYTDGKIDYLVSPNCDNGHSMYTEQLPSNISYEPEYHNWFSDSQNIVASGYTVNVLGGYNDRHGQTVVLTPEFLDTNEFTMSMFSYCESGNSSESSAYLVPKSGFYVTTKEYDASIMAPYEREKMIFGSWPKGHSPVMLVFPDVSELDTAEHFVGWQWPTEGSRIDMVYPLFKNWLTVPNTLWYEVKPNGWTDHTGVIDDEGNYKYYGYYTR